MDYITADHLAVNDCSLDYTDVNALSVTVEGSATEPATQQTARPNST